VTAVTVSVEKNCVLCEVHTLRQTIVSVIFKFQAEAEEIVKHTVNFLDRFSKDAQI
jgi:hypothetical protein